MWTEGDAAHHEQLLNHGFGLLCRIALSNRGSALKNGRSEVIKYDGFIENDSGKNIGLMILKFHSNERYDVGKDNLSSLLSFHSPSCNIKLVSNSILCPSCHS